MSDQAAVHSIDALKEFRAALALFSDDAQAALGAIDLEIRRTLFWLQHDRRTYWQEQIKKRREQVAAAKADLFRRQLARTADYAPSVVEQKEALRKAEAGLHDAELRASLTRKWEQALPQAILEYRASTRRIKDLAGGEVPRASVLLERMILALEAYLREAPPAEAHAPAPLSTIASTVLNNDESQPAEPEPEPETEPDEAPAAPPELPARSGQPGSAPSG